MRLKRREKGNSKMVGVSPGDHGGPGKGPKKFFEFFLKRLYEMCDENTYVVSRYRRGDWYILLRNVGKIEQ